MNTATIYYRSGAYAREHDELDQYRRTSELCRTCARDIDTIISARFDGMHLSKLAILEALAIHGKELVGLVLASTVIDKEWDGRFSRENKEWAHTVRQPDRGGSIMWPVTCRTHPAVLDGFINLYRKATGVKS